MKILPFFISTIILVLCAGIVYADDDVLVIEQATLVSPEATLEIEDSEGNKKDVKPPKSNYGKDPAVAKLKPGDTARLVGKGGADLVISETVTARLDPGTVIKIPIVKASEQKKEEDQEKKRHSLELEKGRAFFTIDAKKLKKQKKKEFRLKTPKKVLAASGTRFVSSSSAELDTSVLLKGEVSITDDFSEKSGEIEPGKALDVRGKGSLNLRNLTATERNYQKVFDQYELVFQPLDQEFRKAVSRSQFFPDRGTWQARSELLKVGEVREENLDPKILQLRYEPGKPIPAEKLQLVCGVPYSQPKLKSLVGLMVSYRSSVDLIVFVEGDFARTEVGTYRVFETISLKKAAADGAWNEVFIPAAFEEGYFSDGKNLQNPELKITPGHLSQWPAEKPVPFTLKIAPILTVSHGKEG